VHDHWFSSIRPLSSTAIDLYPDQVTTWQIAPDGPKATRDTFMAYRYPDCGARTKAAQPLNIKLNTLVHTEDVDLVEKVQAGMATRRHLPGPLSRREDAVAWFARKIRADLETER
jgi:choline monooxygenase